MMVVYMIVSVM